MKIANVITAAILGLIVFDSTYALSAYVKYCNASSSNVTIQAFDASSGTSIMSPISLQGTTTLTPTCSSQIPIYLTHREASKSGGWIFYLNVKSVFNNLHNQYTYIASSNQVKTVTFTWKGSPPAPIN